MAANRPRHRYGISVNIFFKPKSLIKPNFKAA